MLEVAHRLHDYCEEVVDISVAVGGDWHKQVYSSNFSLVAVISGDTGEILDCSMAFDSIVIVLMPLCHIAPSFFCLHAHSAEKGANAC